MPLTRLTDEQRDLAVQDIERTTRCAAAKAKGRIDYDDAIQEASLGVMEAARNFDESRGIKFVTFAQYRANGAVLDACRDRDDLPIYLPRGARQRRANETKRFLRVRSLSDIVGSQANSSHDGEWKERTLAELVPDRVDRVEQKSSDQRFRLDFWIAAEKAGGRYYQILKRLAEGVSKAKIARELRVSPGRVSQLFDEASERVREIMGQQKAG